MEIDVDTIVGYLFPIYGIIFVYNLIVNLTISHLVLR